MPSPSSGMFPLFTPLRASAATTASDAVLKVIQPEPQLSRTYYQDGRLLTAVDLNRDYAYLDRRLLDLGLSIGDGIVQGLDAALVSGQTIVVSQGRGIAPSGRVIAYSDPKPNATLAANLTDSALQATLNGITFSGIGDGLYAVVLLHGAQPTGVAEVFPSDLSSRTSGPESIVDTVEIALVGLPQPVPAGTSFQARAQLARWYATGQVVPVLPSDALALGVVAMAKGLPVWFDPALLRHPLRAVDDPTAVQDDLTRHYVQLYADLIADLATSGAQTFRVADICPLLPPVGQLPAAAIDLQSATQTFFPEQIDVAVMPARLDEIADLLAQARDEPPIDLANAVPAQVLVLVPLAPADYAALTPALFDNLPMPAAPAFRPYPSALLPRIDPLVLRLPGRQFVPPPVNAWQQIMALAPAALPWMVRPTDGGLSGATVGMLAAGFAVVPPSLPSPSPSPTLPPVPSLPPIFTLPPLPPIPSPPVLAPSTPSAPAPSPPPPTPAPTASTSPAGSGTPATPTPLPPGLIAVVPPSVTPSPPLPPSLIATVPATPVSVVVPPAVLATAPGSATIPVPPAAVATAPAAAPVTAPSTVIATPPGIATVISAPAVVAPAIGTTPVGIPTAVITKVPAAPAMTVAPAAKSIVTAAARASIAHPAAATPHPGPAPTAAPAKATTRHVVTKAAKPVRRKHPKHLPKPSGGPGPKKKG